MTKPNKRLAPDRRKVLSEVWLALLAMARGVFLLGLNRLTLIMKTERPNESANRREFLRGSARYALLAGLAAVSAVLVKRGGGSIAGQTCINEGICRGCGAFEDCGLPQALSAKQVLQDSRGSRGNSAQTSKQARGVHAASTSNRESAMKRTEVRAPEARYEA